MSKLSLIKELYVGNGRAYKSKKTGYETVNMLEPVSGYSFTGNYLQNEGEATLVIKHPDGFLVPISRENLFKILSEVTMINGVIQDSCALVQGIYGFGLVKGLSEKYMELRREYEEKLEKESEKKSSYLKRKDVFDFDEVVFFKGKQKVSGFQYVGEVFVLPFETRVHGDVERVQSKDGECRADLFKYKASFNEKLDKRFLFIKTDNQGFVVSFQMLSTFPDVVSRKEGRVLDKGVIRESMKSNFRKILTRLSGYNRGDFSNQYLKEGLRLGNVRPTSYQYLRSNWNVYILDIFYENVGVEVAKRGSVEQFGRMIIE